jgi:hypothetical protein
LTANLPETRVLTVCKLVEGPFFSRMLYGPVPWLQVRVKGWPASTSKAVLVNSTALASPERTATAMEAMMDFILTELRVNECREEAGKEMRG